MDLSRRSFLVLTGTTAVAPLSARHAWAALSRAELNAMVQQEIAESLTEPVRIGRRFASFADAKQRARRTRQARTVRSLLTRLERQYERRGDRLSTWPSDDRSIDYRHLQSLGAAGRAGSTTFTLNHGVLSRIAEANHYTARLQEFPKVIFGLRGCEIVEAGGGMQPTVKLKETVPDHFNRRCVIGVWDRIGARVAVYAGSTVPNRAQVELHRLYALHESGRRSSDPGVWQTHLLPQGLYDYRVATHLDGAGDDLAQPGALIQAKAAPVLRAQSGLSYTHDETWDYLRYPARNAIHASIYLTDFLEFSSSGSQTVYGRYIPKGRNPTGPWSLFRRALQLHAIDWTTGRCESDGENLPYMLTTGREARIHAFSLRRGIAPYRRIRYGSRGPQAEAAQRFLARQGLLRSTVDGAFGRDSAVALLEYQKRRRWPRDAVITPQIAATLNLRW